MMYKKILFFQITPQKKAAIEELCKSLRPGLSIRTAEIKKEQYAESLGFLAGIDGFLSSGKRYSGLPFPGEMLVFSGFSSKELDTFLDAYQKRGLAKIDLKAVLTPQNIGWTPEALFAELRKEHAQFHP